MAITPDRWAVVERLYHDALARAEDTDGHALDEYRADTVRNLDAWYAPFGVKLGQRLYLAPDDRVRVW
jgi:putative endopeptidase